MVEGYIKLTNDLTGEHEYLSEACFPIPKDHTLRICGPQKTQFVYTGTGNFMDRKLNVPSEGKTDE